jgi:phage protein D
MVSEVRAPRMMLVAAGAALFPVELSMQVTVHQAADTFFAKVALDNRQGLDETFWADVVGTNGGGGYVEMFTGQVDRVVLDLKDRSVSVHGRDKTAKMIDAKTHEQWLNKTEKDIITDLAGRAGLGVEFSGDGDSDKAGKQYKEDYTALSDLDTHWNFIIKQARKLGCVAFVKKNTLYVQPVDHESGDTYPIVYHRPIPAFSNTKTLTLSRDLTLAGDIHVKLGKSIKSESKSSGSGGKQLLYHFRAANLTKQQQDRVTKSKVRETASHERTVEIEMPGDVKIDPRMRLALSGTGTAFDQDYIMSGTTHRMDQQGGYQMTISAHAKDSKRGAPEQVE